jgi:hypothetical protein
LNAFEDRVGEAVAAAPQNSRVISLVVSDYDLRINASAHVIDRACLGRCYSYGNYEPSTRQFRVRAIARNPIVAADYMDSFRLQVGGYVVREEDLPLYAVTIAPDGRMSVLPLASGQKTDVTVWDVLEDAPPEK